FRNAISLVVAFFVGPYVRRIPEPSRRRILSRCSQKLECRTGPQKHDGTVGNYQAAPGSKRSTECHEFGELRPGQSESVSQFTRPTYLEERQKSHHAGNVVEATSSGDRGRFRARSHRSRAKGRA